MNKKLAIKGHSTRGKEVIELLEMIGGSNIYNLLGHNSYSCYLNDNHQNIIRVGKYIFDDENICIFTLEEFLEKYPFKVGDKVIDKADGCPGIVTEIKWDEDVSDMKYCVTFGNGIDFGWFVNDSIDFLNVNEMKNVLVELLNHIKNTSKEELEKEFKEIEEWSNVGPTVEEFMDFCEKVNKKPEYPKTYKECRAILNCMVGSMSGYKSSLLASLQSLLICRDAYWKIAGEEMGLGKPWEPDWISGKPFYCISVSRNIIGKGKWYTDNKILAFPSEEMRNAFYENFKDLIETCNELL